LCSISRRACLGSWTTTGQVLEILRDGYKQKKVKNDTFNYKSPIADAVVELARLLIALENIVLDYSGADAKARLDALQEFTSLTSHYLRTRFQGLDEDIAQRTIDLHMVFVSADPNLKAKYKTAALKDLATFVRYYA
jgi:hypothetical protein